MDQLKSMRLFIRIVERSSFSKVAIETGLTQPTISKAIAALEKHLGTRLLNRSARQVRLTEIGSKYYLECRRILDAVAQSEGNVSNSQANPTGLLKLSVPMSFGRLYAVPHVVSFLEKNPGLKIDLAMNSHQVDLIRDGFDLAIQTGNLADSTLIARKIGKNHRVMVATPRYLQKHSPPETPSQLVHHNCILTTETWRLQGRRDIDQIEISGNLRVNNAEGVREAVLLNLGIGVLPLWAVHQEIENGTLKVVLPKYTPASKDIYAVYPYTRHPSSKVRAFITFLEEDLKRVSYLPSRRTITKQSPQCIS